MSLERLRASLADRYTLERELGAGGMATVYLAHDIKHDRKVAVKVLRPELAAVIGADRFLAEIKTTANLQHPHILPLFDSGEADSFLFYVMPYVEGISLRDRMTREKQLPINEAVRIASEVASALDYAHRHGVIHRDIKPENIMLHDGSALVADFGIALAASKAGSRMTETGMSLGTPQYMSPEQAMGERELDARSDVYALGCVTYEMLTGEPPFSGPTAQAIIAKVMTSDPVEVSSLRKSVPPAVAEAVHTALQKVPADRFATAAEFAATLGGTRTTTQRVTSARMTDWPRSAKIAALVAFVALPLMFMIGKRTGSPTNGIEYQGEPLGGSLTAFAPRVSPDGQSVAFAAIVKGQAQLGLLKSASGDWTVLTRDTAGGSVGEIAWSPDGTRIYFSRYYEMPRGVYSISALGGDERLILENAGTPEALADGSLLVSRVNARRKLQMYHYWPENGRIDTLDAISEQTAGSAFFRLFADGREAVYFGTTQSDSTAAPHIAIIDIKTNRSRPLAAGVDLSTVSVTATSFGTTRDGKSVLVDIPVGDFHRIFAIPRDGSSDVHLLLTTAGNAPANIDTGPDGSIYLDQGTRPEEIIRYAPTDHRLERMKLSSSQMSPIPIDGGRMLGVVRSATRRRVMLFAPGKSPVPLVNTAEETTGPVARLGTDRIVLQLGSSPRQLAVASLATGRIVATLGEINPISAAGSVDGTTIYYVKNGSVYAIPSTGGPARLIHPGDAVATDPHGRYLVVQLNELNRVQLVRVSLNGAPDAELVAKTAWPFAATAISPSAVGMDGRIAVRLAPPSSWFWPAAIFDPVSGRIDVVPAGEEVDVVSPAFDEQGRLVGGSLPMEVVLWRYKPVVAGKRK